MNKKLFFLLLTYSLLINAQWQNLNLNQNILSSHRVGDVEFAGTSTGVYYKNASSTNWTQSSGISSKALSFTYHNNILYTSSYERLYKSLDNGINWTAMSVVRTFNDMNNISIENSSNFIVGVKGYGISFSADGGNQWWGSDTSWQSNNSAIVKMGNSYFASYKLSGYLQQSTNNTGQQWFTPSGNGLKIGLSSSYQDITTLAVLNDSILIAGTNNSANFSSYNGIYFSEDNGNNFSKKINGLASVNISSITTIGNLIFAGTEDSGVFYSNNNGNNWSALNNGLTNLNVNKLYVYEDKLYASTANSIFRLDICNLLQGTSKINPNGNIIVPIGSTKLLKANLGGKNYAWYKNGVIIPNSNSNIYSATESGNYYVSINYSNTCTDNSNIVSLDFQNLNTNESENKSVKLYPNPISDYFTVKNNKNGNFNFIIYDLVGRKIKAGKGLFNEKIFINIAKGTYLITVEGTNNLILKEKISIK